MYIGTVFTKSRTTDRLGFLHLSTTVNSRDYLSLPHQVCRQLHLSAVWLDYNGIVLVECADYRHSDLTMHMDGHVTVCTLQWKWIFT